MLISYKLKNKGSEPIMTQSFNHNFFVFDNLMRNVDFELIFNDEVKGEFRNENDLMRFQGNKLKILREFESNKSVYCGSVTTISDKPVAYDLKIENHKTGAGVRIV